MFNNGQSKHRLVTLKEETFADSLDYITLKTALVDKYGTWQYIEKNSTPFINEQLDRGTQQQFSEQYLFGRRFEI